MKKIVVFGSFVCDLVARMNRFPVAGESVVGNSFNTFLGGKGANQCMTINRLNGNVTMIGKVGNDLFGDNFINEFKKEGLNTNYIFRSDKSTGVGCVQIEESGQNRICIVLGANLDFNNNDLEKVKDVIKQNDIFITQFEMDEEVTYQAIKFAKESNLLTIVNPAPARKLKEEYIKYIDYITPNETELGLLTGHEVNNIPNIIEAAKILLSKGIKNIVVTLGEKGALLVNKDCVMLVSAYKVNVVDTVAAGDSFNGALAYSLSKDLDIVASLKFANAMGALTTTVNGAFPSLHKLDEVNEFIKNNQELKAFYIKGDIYEEI